MHSPLKRASFKTTTAQLAAGLSLVLLTTLLTTGSAQAGGIKYVFSGTVSGSLGTTAFTNAPVTFTAFGDTTGVVAGPLGVTDPNNPVGMPTFTLSGVGSGTFTDAFVVFDNQTNSIVGLNDTAGNFDLFGIKAPAFSTYGLTTPLGPVASIGDAVGNSGFFFQTTAGDLIILSFGPGSFMATPPAAVPEASTTVSFGLLALGGVLFAAKKRKSAV